MTDESRANHPQLLQGKDLIRWGFAPGSWFKDGLALANQLAREGAPEAVIIERLRSIQPPDPIPLRAAGELTFHVNVEPQGFDEVANVDAVLAHMKELMRVPTLVAGAVMPDACPVGRAPGTIPVGGVVAADNAIHPGFHSSDICCSMAVSLFDEMPGTPLLDAGMTCSHFGPGGRAGATAIEPPSEILRAMADNPFLRDLRDDARGHFATQGDGNHFFYVGRLASSGQTALVTHHGSRRPGAMLYKQGMAVAQRYRALLSPETPLHNAWIPADEGEGQDYWRALQIIRAWTKASHFAIHDAVASHLGREVRERFWNEHNFVFFRDGLYYHAKGATPAWGDFAPDSSGKMLIPLNMAAPVLVVHGSDAPHGLGFCPHGAGRNFGRREFVRRQGDRTPEELMAEQTRGIDARFFCGIPDASELPGAYKDANAVRAQIDAFGLAEVVDEITPLGSIMAGDWEQPFRARRQRLREEKRQTPGTAPDPGAPDDTTL